LKVRVILKIKLVYKTQISQMLFDGCKTTTSRKENVSQIIGQVYNSVNIGK